MQKLAITWYGHSTFVITTPGGKRIVTDPFLEQNPVCPPNMKKITAADVILVSHGHSDHTSDVPAVSRATNAPIVAVYELALWLERKGLANVQGMGIGGTVHVAGLEVSMVPAVHTSSVVENDTTVYLGQPAGFVVRMEDERSFYFAGDTDVFGDMRLIAEIYAPTIAFLPNRGSLHDESRWCRHRRAPPRRPPGRAHALWNVPRAHRHPRATQEARGASRHRRAEPGARPNGAISLEP